MPESANQEIGRVVRKADVALDRVGQIWETIQGWQDLTADSIAAQWAPLLMAKIENLALTLEETLHELRTLSKMAGTQAVTKDHSSIDLESLVDHERRLIVEALQRHAWNQSGAARALGITRYHLRHRMKKYDIRKPSNNGS